jgi:hypothetical protein
VADLERRAGDAGDRVQQCEAGAVDPGGARRGEDELDRQRPFGG